MNTVDFAACNMTVLSGTGAVALNSLAAGDIKVYGVRVLKNAGPATATIAGWADQSGTAQSFVVSGSTADDRDWIPPCPVINSKAALSITPSVTLTVIVYWAPVRS